MRSIQRRFRNISERNPAWSSLVCFAEAIKGRGFCRQAIHRWFIKLVKKDDYSGSDKKTVYLHLEAVTKCVEDDKKWGKKSPLTG